MCAAICAEIMNKETFPIICEASSYGMSPLTTTIFVSNLYSDLKQTKHCVLTGAYSKYGSKAKVQPLWLLAIVSNCCMVTTAVVMWSFKDSIHCYPASFFQERLNFNIQKTPSR